MKLVFLAASIVVLGAALPAKADIIVCRPNSFVSWQGGEANASENTDPSPPDLFIDLDTGLLWRLGQAPLYYEVFRTGPMGGDTDFVAFSAEAAALIRVRLADSELQFMYDYGRTIDVGTCSFAPEGTTP